MFKISDKLTVIILTIGLGGFLSLPCGRDSAAAGSSKILGEQAGNRTKNVQVVLTCDKTRVSLTEILQIDAVIWNIGADDVYLFRRMEWGDGGGMALDIRDEKGKSVGPWIDFLLPPPSRDDPAMFVLLGGYRCYGARLEEPGNRLVHRPGRYTVQVEYQCPFSRHLYEGRFRNGAMHLTPAVTNILPQGAAIRHPWEARPTMDPRIFLISRYRNSSTQNVTTRQEESTRCSRRCGSQVHSPIP